METSRASNRPIIIKKSMSPINIGLLLGLWEEASISEKARRIDKASALFFWVYLMAAEKIKNKKIIVAF